MKFNRLRLLGFKSFVEPSDFVIEGGLTGVVGPNGCGKSNLVEALRWVMGENSYKNMRASGMDDVIFSGSSTRPSRNTAEVTLFLDNADRRAPAAFNDQDELQVSRRIEREAGSVYRINGKEARAKDVQLLFADQSTGARSPSMVGQGRIGELIQAKPQARRALLEEAAGISGLHSRRHEAELRLRAAEQNLDRLDDVVRELETQIENLKRQARQATRFKNLSAEIRQSEAILLHLRWTAAKEQEGEAKSALAQAMNAVAAEAGRQMEAAKNQAIGANALPGLREAEARAAAALQRLTIERVQIDEEAERLRVREAELAKRLAQLAQDIAREEQIVADNAATLARLDEEERQLSSDQANAADRQVASLGQLERATQRLTEAEAIHGRLTAERAEAAAGRIQAERALRDAAERRDRAERQLAANDQERAGIAAKLAELPDPAEKQRLVDEAAAALATAESTTAAAEKTVAALRQREAQARPPVQEARQALARVETEAKTLARVLHAGASDSRYPAVVEQLKVERGFETALGAALGEDLDAPIDPAAPAHWAEFAPGADDPALPDGVRSLADVVRAPNQLKRRLQQVGIVDASGGAALQGQLRVGQRLVSREGALWRWDGYRASADAPTPAAQRLAQKNRLQELEAEVAEAARALRMAEETLQLAEAELKRAVENERRSRETGRLAQAALGQARDALSRAERASGELTARRAALAEAQAQIGQAQADAIAAHASAAEALAACADLGELEARLAEASTIVQRERAAVADARAAHDGLAREAEMRTRRLAGIASERAAWSQRAQNADTHIASLKGRMAEATAERAGMEDAPNEIELRRRAVLTQLAEAEKARKAAADWLQEAENAQRSLDKAATDAIQTLSQSREARVRAEERLAAAEDRRKEIEARIAEALNVAPHLLMRHAGLEPDAPLPEIGEIERRLDRLKVERERLGAVNLRAEEESREMTERLDLIVREREDVVEAIRRLRLAIQSLNREGRERLLAAFSVVNGHFQKLFSHLFGGGTAELQLIESDDPLEAGLEILARPPSKKPQTMTLLSGGEQALTAMALIFAVFLTNPAPICVLDEVDAPLDDHNVERFCNLLDEMAATTDTRFVVITHNPITMARMDRLFGVTMPEQGVSQLVSVDLQSAERLREAS
jgi:chromosome segregation protein